MGYMISAEFGCHIPLGWGQPACALDPYVEFRHFTNDGAVKAGEREKGFYSLNGALQYFCENGIDTAHKDEMRDRIIQGPPFSADERATILDYCEEDVRALALLVRHIAPTIRSLPHALGRAKFMWTVAQQERRGVPLDLPLLTSLREQWDEMQGELVREMDAPFGIYEFDKDGKPHWREQRFAGYLIETVCRGLPTPTGRSTSATRPSEKWKAAIRRYRTAARVAILDLEAAAQRSRGWCRRPQPHHAWPLRQ